MKHFKKFLLAVLVALGSFPMAFAYDFEVDGIYYLVTSYSEMTCEVVSNNKSGNTYSGDIVIPDHIENNGDVFQVTSIAGRAFYGCSLLNSVTIPETIKSMGKDAFYSSYSLTAVYINNLENWLNISFTDEFSNPLYFSNNLYLNNKLVTEVSFPTTNNKINNYVLSGGECITNVTIPENVTEIGDGAFYGCNKLQSISLPKNLTTIGAKAFEWCKEITSIKLPESITSIGDEAFFLCKKLNSIVIPKNVTKLGDKIFRDCSNLVSVKIPDGVTSIRNFAG